MAKLHALCVLVVSAITAVSSVNDRYYYKADNTNKYRLYENNNDLHQIHRRDVEGGNHSQSNTPFYNRTIQNGPEIGLSYWVDMEKDGKINDLLSKSYRRASIVKLSFKFPFCGHLIDNIKVATGGFIFTGDYVHTWLAATQYIAPLMANFDLSISNDSYVKYRDSGTTFTVEWENVSLKDQPSKGKFTFQATLHQNGDIVFVYKSVPFSIQNISSEEHPVKVGVSDAYMLISKVFNGQKKTIYEYYKTKLEQEDIRDWTVIYLTALPTCLQNGDCISCVNNVIPSFSCTWCPRINKCSSGIDRNRQEWLDNECPSNNAPICAG